ncbi:MAG: hypothetical protein WA359_09475 [Acidimicrobiales bacterium]
MTSFNQSSQWSLRADEMLLADDFVEGSRAQEFRQGRCRAQALARGLVKE